MFYPEAKEKIKEELAPWHDFNLKVMPVLSWPLFVTCYAIEDDLDGLLMSGLSCAVVLAYAASNAPPFSEFMAYLRSKKIGLPKKR